LTLEPAGPALAPRQAARDGRPLGRVWIRSLGCRLNEAESEEWAERLQARGLAIVGPDEPADLVIVNTCAVTAEAVRKSRQILRRARRSNPKARVVVSGCLATLGDASISADQGIDLVVPNPEKDRLVETLLETLAVPAMPAAATDDTAGALFARGRQRAFVKIQDGCRYQCTFCVTTQARGPERSRQPQVVIDAVRRCVAHGIQEVVLAGVHLGGYGQDLGLDLCDLLERLLGETDIPRLRIGSLEPWDLDGRFWRLFTDRRLMPHLHLPLQSGSDRVLRRMARRCRTAQFADLLDQGRSRVADLNVTTDIIIGFPGEDAMDWERTLRFVEAMRFGQIHPFVYSRRPGTRAADYPDQVDSDTKRARLADLQILAGRMRRRLLDQQVGKRVEMLCEGNPDDARVGGHFGYTPNYLPVLVDDDRHGIIGGQRLAVELLRVDPGGPALIARPVEPSDRSEPTLDLRRPSGTQLRGHVGE
jgi:threonylcarbamoyladenosine tRNA methylthiotransferase MtaB